MTINLKHERWLIYLVLILSLSLLISCHTEEDETMMFYDVGVATEHEGRNDLGPRHADNTQMQRGCVITSWQNQQYTETQVDDTLGWLKSIGCTWVSVVVTWYQSEESSPYISPLEDATPGTPDDEGVELLINKIKQRGMTPNLKPHIDLQDGTWRGNITFDQESDWTIWFNEYRIFVSHYAEIAERSNVPLLVIGTELKGTTHRAEWRDVITDVRSIFHGQVVYAANHDHYMNVPFWNLLDYIGIDGYFPLTDDYNPTPEMLSLAFKHIAQDLRAFSEMMNLKIIFTELGYQSFDGTNTTPWSAPTMTPDEREQADCYHAVLQAFYDQDWVVGMYFWHTHFDRYDWDGFGIANKEAEAVLREWYHPQER